MAPISFANATFSAWKLLLAYLSISASPKVTARRGHCGFWKRSCMTLDARLVWGAYTLRPGAEKSASPCPSRRNSG